MIDIRTGKGIKDFHILEDNQFYIYVLLNSDNKVKIGRTKNIQQRYKSLCGSNGQGNEIVSVCCSEVTFLYTLERIMHEKFKKYRIPGTEWFCDESDSSGEILFNNAVRELELLFSSAEYKKCNDARKNFYESSHKEVGDACDN